MGCTRFLFCLRRSLLCLQMNILLHWVEAFFLHSLAPSFEVLESTLYLYLVLYPPPLSILIRFLTLLSLTHTSPRSYQIIKCSLTSTYYTIYIYILFFGDFLSLQTSRDISNSTQTFVIILRRTIPFGLHLVPLPHLLDLSKDCWNNFSICIPSLQLAADLIACQQNHRPWSPID